MRGGVLVGVQILMSLVVAALVTPAVLTYVPATRAAVWGPVAVLGLTVVTFVLVRLAWPARKS
jgi:hypothetical protein